jgi:hypothetical protein
VAGVPGTFSRALTCKPNRRTNGIVAPDPKDERFQIRMSGDEREMLRVLAEQAGESEATVVRQLIKRAFEAHEAKAAKKR